ncbi:MAG: hypothetical protein SGPRY_007837 [Prymnesium sp.]
MPKAHLSFPPLVASQRWTVKSEANWPGADYTRRSRMKTSLLETYNADFLSEIESSLGPANFVIFREAMLPATAPEMPRGRPPAERGTKFIQPPYTLRRKHEERGRASTSRFLEKMQSQYGPAPSYLWEDREQMGTISEWFDKYGRPSPNPLNRGLYTSYEKSSRRCCGEPSQVQRMKRGTLTS